MLSVSCFSHLLTDWIGDAILLRQHGSQTASMNENSYNINNPSVGGSVIGGAIEKKHGESARLNSFVGSRNLQKLLSLHEAEEAKKAPAPAL